MRGYNLCVSSMNIYSTVVYLAPYLRYRKCNALQEKQIPPPTPHMLEIKLLFQKAAPKQETSQLSNTNYTPHEPMHSSQNETEYQLQGIIKESKQMAETAVGTEITGRK